MDPQPPQLVTYEEKLPSQKNRPTVLVLVALGLLVAIAGAFAYPPSRAFLSGLVLPGHDADSRLSGTLYLSMAPMRKTSTYLELFGLNTASLEQRSLLATEGTDYYAAAVSPDGKSAAFIQSTDGSPLIGVAPIGENGNPDIAQEKTYPVYGAHPLYPSWSHAGTVLAYSVLPAGISSASSTPDDWEVYTIDLSSGFVTKVSQGMFPQFIPDGGLVVLRNDGLHVLDISDSAIDDTRVWNVQESTVEPNMKFDISSDGTKIVWVFPNLRKTYRIDVSSWEDITGTITEITDGSLLTLPKLSPDAKFVALFDPEQNRVVVYDLATNQQVERFSTAGYYADGVFISDWK